MGTVTERLAIRADRRVSTPIEQGESGSKRPDSNPGAFFGPKCSDRLPCEHAHPSLLPVHFAQCPARAHHMHCVTVNLTPHRVHARCCRFRRLRRARLLTMSNNLALFALDCFVPVCEPSSRARDPRPRVLCVSKRSDPGWHVHSHVHVPRRCPHQFAALTAAIAGAQAGAGRAPGLGPSTAECRCSVPVAPPPPLPLVRVRGAPEACHRGGQSVRFFFYLINRKISASDVGWCKKNQNRVSKII